MEFCEEFLSRITWSRYPEVYEDLNIEEMRIRLGFDDKPESGFKSAHGGLTEDEQKIPLITF